MLKKYWDINMRKIIIIVLIICVQLSIFAKNDNALYLIYTIKSNIPIVSIRIGLYSSRFKHIGTQIPYYGRLYSHAYFRQCITSPIKIEYVDTNHKTSMCDTIPFRVRLNGFFYESSMFDVSEELLDTLFRSYGQDTIYKELNINFTDEQVQRYIDEYLKHGDY